MLGSVADTEKQRMTTALRLQHPLTIVRGDPKHTAKGIRTATATAAAKRRWMDTAAPLPNHVHLVSFHMRQQPGTSNEEYVVRVQNVVEGSPVATVDLGVGELIFFCVQSQSA